MNQLTKIRELIRPESSRRRISRKLASNYGEGSSIYINVLNARDTAVRVYRGKKRKNGDKRISHEDDMLVIAIHHEINYEPLLVAIYLHDLHEDYRRLWPLYLIAIRFGELVKGVVGPVTKPPLRGRNLVSLEYSLAMAKKVDRGGYYAILLKCIDRLDYLIKPFANPKNLSKEDRLKIIWKVRQTIDHIIPMSLEIGFLTVELQLGVADVIKKYKITSAELAAVAEH